MTVEFGTVCPDGFLPVFSVDTKAQAKALMAFVPRDLEGKKYAKELLDQAGRPLTGAKRIDGFVRFGLRLQFVYEQLQLQRQDSA